jgi:hypothetical protein
MNDKMENPATSSSPGFEAESIGATAILRMVLGVFVFILILLYGVLKVTDIEFKEAKTEATTVSGYPLLRETRAHAASRLSGYAPIDRDAGIYQIPVERAMELVVRDAERENERDQ